MTVIDQYIKEQYKKERKRIQNLMYRGRKKGYIFKENILPKIPKNISEKSIERLRKLTPEKIYKGAKFVDVETGVYTSAKAHKKEVKKQAIEKAKATKALRKKEKEFKATYMPEPPTIEYETTPTPYNSGYIDIIENIRLRIAELTRDVYPVVPINSRKNDLLQIFDDTVAEFEDNLNELMQYLREHEARISTLLDQIAHESGGKIEDRAMIIEKQFGEIGEILNMAPLSMIQAEQMSTMSEYNV